MNIFVPTAIVTVFFFSLRYIDRVRYKNLRNSITEEEEKMLQDLGFFK